MKLSTTFFFASLLLVSPGIADEPGKLIFEDNFERNESQEEKDEIGNGWGINSRTRAGGHKQADLRSGALYIKMHATADHAVSVTHPADFDDGRVELRFMLEDPRDVLGLDFADLSYKEVHAGHLFKVDVSAKGVRVNDMKSGNMNLKYYDKDKAKSLTAEDKQFLNTTRMQFPAEVGIGEWHTLAVTVQGKTVSVSIDGEPAGSFSSPGFDHETKKMLRVAVPREAVIDDVKIFSLPSRK